MPRKIAIFASGSGSNALKIISFFRNRTDGAVALIVSNKATAGVLQIAEEHRIPTRVINRSDFYRPGSIAPALQAAGIELVVLAGFLWKIPNDLVTAFAGRMINIHPSLLPAYGGKGMYGMHVHEAVVAAGEKQSGITIHQVDQVYDNGEVIFQARCEVHPEDTADDVRQKVQQLEHTHFPRVVANVLAQLA